MANIALSRWNELLTDDDMPLPDGTASGTDIDAWQRALDALVASGWPVSFERDNAEAPLPAASQLFDAASFNVVLVRPDPGVLVIVRPMSPDSFDFDLDAREVTTQDRVDALCEFVRLVGTALRRDVELSHEGAPIMWFCRFEFSSGQFQTRSTT